MFILVGVIWGMGNAFLIPSLSAIGTLTAIQDLGTGLGPVIMGVVLRLTNYPVMFLCLALIGIINLNYFFFFVRKKGRR